MVWLKRIGKAVAIIALVMVIAFFLFKKYAETYSFAPEAPEQAQLAAEHAQCAGYYTVMRASLKKERPDYAEQEKEYTSEFEHHAKMGFNFSPDKDQFKAQIKKAVSHFTEEVIAAGKAGGVPELIRKKTNGCYATLFRSGDFVNQKLHETSRRN